jgi:hypothetical protein
VQHVAHDGGGRVLRRLKLQEPQPPPNTTELPPVLI